MTGTDADQALSDLVRRNVERMAFRPSEREAASFSEVMALPRIIVNRPPANDLLAAGFVHYDCHRNCADQAANDTTGASRHVVGWLPYGDDLILHSVAVIGGRWICLTPQLVPAASRFEFIPDHHVQWRDHADGSRIPFRHGRYVPNALRRDPERHIRKRDEFLALVATGMSAIEARDEVARKSRD